MAEQENKGLGTGSAQVFDYSGIQRAIGKSFDLKIARDAKDQEDKAKKETATQRAVNKLKGSINEIDRTKVRSQEYDAIQKYKEFIDNKYRGKYKSLLGEDPSSLNEYNADIDKMKSMIFKSTDAKSKELKLIETINNNPLISLERKEEIFKLIETPFWDPAASESASLYERDKARPDFSNNMKKMVPNMEALYDKKVNTSHINAKGGYTKITRKSYSKTEEAYQEWKAMLDNDLMKDIDIIYKKIGDSGEDRTSEEKFRLAYDRFVNEEIVEEESIETKSNPEVETTEVGSGVKGINSTYFKGEDYEGFTIADPKKELVPVTVSVEMSNEEYETVRFRPSEFVRGIAGKSVKGQVLNDSWSDLSDKQRAEWKQNNPGKEHSEYVSSGKGSTREIPWTPEVAAKFKDQYGIDFETNLESVKEDGAGGLTGEDRAAYDWAKANPKDSRAKKILKRLGK